MTDETRRTPGSEDPRRGRRTRTGLIIILIILILMLLGLGYAIYRVVGPVGGSGSDTETTGGLEWVRSIYSFGPGQDQTLDSPVATAVGDDGTIYAVDTQTNMVMAFNPDGTVRDAVNLLEISDMGYETYAPKSITVVDNGDVYVGTFFAEVVFVFDRNLNLIRSFQLEAIPYAIVEDGETLLISTNEGILRFTPEGEFIGPFALRGRGAGEVDLAQGMTLTDDGVLFVTDSMNGRVQAFDAGGTSLWVTAFGSALNEEARPSQDTSASVPFQVPVGIALDGKGRVVISDMQAMEIFVLDPNDGTVLAQYGEFGPRDGQLTYPMGMAYDPQRDWFVLADMGNSRLQVLRLPESAAFSAAAAVRRGIVGPVWVCCIPLLLLLVLLALAVMRRRRGARESDGHDTRGTENDVDNAVVADGDG